MFFIIPISNVAAPPPPVALKPAWFRTLKGTLVSGDLGDLQNFYDDAVHWKGKFAWVDPPFGFGHIVEPALYYADPGPLYQYVCLTVRFKYSGNTYLRIYVWYSDGTHDQFPESSTGGSYVLKGYTLDSYKKVTYISFYSINSLPAAQQHVYIDCAEVGYSPY